MKYSHAHIYEVMSLDDFAKREIIKFFDNNKSNIADLYLTVVYYKHMEGFTEDNYKNLLDCDTEAAHKLIFEVKSDNNNLILDLLHDFSSLCDAYAIAIKLDDEPINIEGITNSLFNLIKDTEHAEFAAIIAALVQKYSEMIDADATDVLDRVYSLIGYSESKPAKYCLDTGYESEDNAEEELNDTNDIDAFDDSEGYDESTTHHLDS